MSNAAVQFTELLRQAQAQRHHTCLLCGAGELLKPVQMRFPETGGATLVMVCLRCQVRFPDDESLALALARLLGAA